MKNFIIWAFLMITLISISTAITVNYDPEGNLVDNSYQTSQTIQYGFNVTGQNDTYTCKLWHNENGSNGLGMWREVQTVSSVSNNSNTEFTSSTSVAEISGLNYCWDIHCNSTGEDIGDWAGNSNATHCNVSANNYSVDVTDPSVTVNYPASDGEWYTTNTDARIGLTVIDNNAAQCDLYTILNITSNSTVRVGTWYSNTSNKDETATYTNNTAFNFTKINATLAWADNNTGAYKWYYSCNDSAGQITTIASNLTFNVDTVAPTTFGFNFSLFQTTNGIGIVNASTSTDYTPTVGWNLTTDLNFSRYEIWFYKYNIGNTTYVAKNITSRTTLSTSMSTLSADTNYAYKIIAYDAAGNSKDGSDAKTRYTTDSTSRVLSNGWNIIMNTGNPMGLSAILNNSGATQTSYFNASNAFETHVTGGSYANTQVPYGEAVFVYISSGTSVMEDWVVNTSASVYGLKFNITNQTNSDWNIPCNKNSSSTGTSSARFHDVDTYQKVSISLNITYMSLFNNSGAVGSQYIPYVNNWTINNLTRISYGDCCWMFKNPAVATSFYELDWGLI